MSGFNEVQDTAQAQQTTFEPSQYQNNIDHVNHMSQQQAQQAQQTPQQPQPAHPDGSPSVSKGGKARRSSPIPRSECLQVLAAVRHCPLSFELPLAHAF